MMSATRAGAAVLAACAALAVCWAPSRGTAQTASPATPPAASPGAPASFDKELTKELARGRLIDAIERKKPRKPYAAPERMFKPYVDAETGPAVAYELTQGTEFANAPAAQALCQSIVDKMLDGWKGPRPVVRVYITADSSFHGEMKPSGLMLISLGAFNSDYVIGATNVEELTLLIGHELSHMLLGHLEDAKTMDGVAQALNIMAGGYMAYGQLSKSHMVDGKFTAEGDPRMFRRGLIAGLASQTLIRDLLRPSFGRGKELEADRLGIDLARRAGFAVTEGTIRDFVDHHAADQATTTARIAALATVLHALNEEAARKALQAAQKDDSPFSGIVQKMTRELGNTAIDATLSFVASRNKDHPDPQERIAFDQNYLRLNHDTATTLEGGRLPRKDLRLRDIAQSPEVSALVTHVTRAATARRDLVKIVVEEDPAKSDAAMREVLKNAGLQRGGAAAAKSQATAKAAGKTKGPAKAAPATPTTPAVAGFGDDNAALTWSMEGLLRDMNGGQDAALQSWQRGVRTALPSIDIAGRWARGLPPERRGEAIPPVLARYKKLLGADAPVLDLAVGAAVGQGNIALAETTAAQCLVYNGGSLYPSCVQFLGYDPSNKDTPAQTDEGRKAFQNKSFEKSFSWMKNLGELF